MRQMLERKTGRKGGSRHHRGDESVWDIDLRGGGDGGGSDVTFPPWAQRDGTAAARASTERAESGGRKRNRSAHTTLPVSQRGRRSRRRPSLVVVASSV